MAVRVVDQRGRPLSRAKGLEWSRRQIERAERERLEAAAAAAARRYPEPESLEPLDRPTRVTYGVLGLAASAIVAGLAWYILGKLIQ
jgi:hypothetical protein